MPGSGVAHVNTAWSWKLLSVRQKKPSMWNSWDEDLQDEELFCFCFCSPIRQIWGGGSAFISILHGSLAKEEACLQQPTSTHTHTKANPTCSMYGIFTYIYHQLKPNVGKYSSSIRRIWEWTNFAKKVLCFASTARIDPLTWWVFKSAKVVSVF